MRTICTVLFLLLLSSFTTAEPLWNSDMPVWLLIEKGRGAIESAEYGHAVRIFRAVLEKNPDNPKAEFYIGEIFRAEGEYRLAELQYKKAIANRHLLEDPTFAFAMQYRLADLHRVLHDADKYEEALLAVFIPDALEEPGIDYPLLAGMRRTLIEGEGLDKMLELYRVLSTQYLRAHSLLGYYYYNVGRYEEAVDHLILAAITTYSVIIQELLRLHPAYEFGSIRELPDYIARYTHLQLFENDAEPYKLLYYLALSLWGLCDSDAAVHVWTKLSDIPAAGQYHSRARSKLLSPGLDEVYYIF